MAIQGICSVLVDHSEQLYLGSDDVSKRATTFATADEYLYDPNVLGIGEARNTRELKIRLHRPGCDGTVEILVTVPEAMRDCLAVTIGL